MYKHKFENSPLIVEMIRNLGANGFTDLILTSETGGLFNKFPEELTRSIRDAIVSRLKPLFAAELSTSKLYMSFFSMWRETHEQWDDRSADERSQIKRATSFFARDVHVLDMGSDKVAAMIGSRSVDWKWAYENERVIMANDPEWQVHVLKWSTLRRHASSPMLDKLFECSIGRIALKETRKDINWCRGERRHVVAHVIDWIVSAHTIGARWLANLDDVGRPKKLMKYGTIEAMEADAERHMQKLLAEARKKKTQDRKRRIEQGDEEVFSDGDEAFHLVRLKTPRALDVESEAMRHCVGHGAYDDLLNDPHFAILSLRDSEGVPHVTIELHAGEVIQMRGKANSEPKAEYAAAVSRLLMAGMVSAAGTHGA